MLLVGLTGGIGAGKSTVARLLSQRGAVLIDADAIARDAVRAGTPAWKRVVERFGEDVLDDAGEIDRARLARIVFSDEDARASLNAIVHPEVMRVIAERIEALNDGDDVVVLDVPLLVEVGGGDGLDLMIVVEADEASRVDRLVRDRAMQPEDIRARIAAQATEEERKALADVIVRNDGDEAALEREVAGIWDRIEHMRPGGPR